MQITRIMPALRNTDVPGTTMRAAAEAVITFADGEQQHVQIGQRDLIRLIAQASKALANFEGITS